MQKNYIKIVSSLVFVLSILISPLTWAANNCNRACLEGFVDEYMNALLAHDSTDLPLAAGVRFTENTVEIPIGKGLWGTVSSMDDFRVYAADPQTGQVGLMAVLYEHDKAGMFSLRLKIENQKITEIETMHSRGNFFSMETLNTPREAFSKALETGERRSREELHAAAMAYGDAVEESNGNAAPFSNNCERHENGVQTTGVNLNTPDEPGLGCADQMSSGAFDNTDQVSDRRFPLIDEERGLVMGYFVFQLPGPATKNRDAQEPFSGPVTEIFKIRNGEIHEVEAVLMPTLPYGSGTGW